MSSRPPIKNHESLVFRMRMETPDEKSRAPPDQKTPRANAEWLRQPALGSW